MLEQIDPRLTDTRTPTISCFEKEKSGLSVMEFPEETGNNNTLTSDGTEQQSLGDPHNRSNRNIQTNNPAGAANTGHPSVYQYDPFTTISAAPGTVPFDPYGVQMLQLGSQPLHPQNTLQMPSVAGTMPHQGSATTGPPHYTQPLQHQYPYPVYQPGATAAAGGGPSLSGHPTQYHPHEMPQHQMGYYTSSQSSQQNYPQQALTFNNAMNQNNNRPSHERPIIKLSRSLIDTYKDINTLYYNAKTEKDSTKKPKKPVKNKPDPSNDPGGSGSHNNGYDDENYDYILTPNELIKDRYKIQERLGKGSFGQVVRAVDIVTETDVAIKIIKSRRPFQIQAKTEIDILTHLNNRDGADEHNIVRLLTQFEHRNHQCLVFEMLSLNLYELLKNTQFVGVSLHLIRKFAKQILKSLKFLARPDVDVIHCDLKPENILLRHPKRSGIKVIDFGSSCLSNKRMYPYIQSRFYRSPEVLLGLPYTVAIDMWSLGCILLEMHTGEPLFSGSDQFDQMQKIVKILGMVPDEMLNQIGEEQRTQFFVQDRNNRWAIKQKRDQTEIVVPSSNPVGSLMQVLQNKINENQQSIENYKMFVDLIYKMLAYRPEDRITPEESMLHPFITTEHTIKSNH